MGTYRDALLGLTSYPVSLRTIEAIALERGLSLDDTVAPGDLKSREYMLAKADIFKYLFSAPNVSQGGQSYSFSTDQREVFRKVSDRLYRLYGDAVEQDGVSGNYGYMGSRL